MDAIFLAPRGFQAGILDSNELELTVLTDEESTVLIIFVAQPDPLVVVVDIAMGPLGEFHVAITVFISMIELIHLSEVLLPHGEILIDHRMVALVFQFYEFIISWEEHTNTVTLWGTVGIANFQPLWTLKSGLDVVGNITVGIGIP